MGEATQDVTITVKAEIAATHAGTAEDPYTVEDALAILETLAEDGMIQNKVYVKGYLKSVGTYGSSYYSTLYLVDAIGNTQELLVYSCNLNSTANITEAYQNDLVVISGYLKNYGGTLELAQNGTDYAKFESRSEGTSTISVSANSSDKATVALGATSAANGTTFTFTVSVTKGYELVSVKVVDGKGVSDPLTANEGTYTATVKGNTAVLVETKEAGAATLKSVSSLTFVKNNTVNQKVNDYTSTWDATSGDHTFTMVNFNNNNNGWTYIRGGKKNTTGSASISTTIAEAVKQVKVSFDSLNKNGTLNSVTLTVKNGDEVLETVTLTELTKELVINLSKATTNCTYELTFNYENKTSTNGTFEVSQVEYFA